MSTYTKYYKLIKPSYDEDIDVQDINNNMDVIDNTINGLDFVQNTHNTSSSAHAPITNQIKAILGSTNWQDNPTATIKEITDKLGFGGVVAQRIGTNGFIKFASGLTIQWGVQKETFETPKDGIEYKCTLPIAFQNKPLIAIGVTQSDDKVNHYTFVNVNHFPANDTNSTVSFYCWRDWDWSANDFRLAYFTIGV